MNVTAITCTYQRPAAMALCEVYLKRQTRVPWQWLVLDGPEPMPKKILRAIQTNQISGDVVAFVEDDDWFRDDWIEWGAGMIAKGYDLVGEGMAVYYNVRRRWWSECRNVRHAALCQTIVSRDMLESIANVIQCFDSPFFDTRIWPLECSKFLALPKSPAERRVVGIKGMPGLTGYSSEHRQVAGAKADPSLLQLWKWIGQDAANYTQFNKP